MTFVLGGLRCSGDNLRRNELTLKESAHALQALFLLRRRLLPVRGLLLPSLQEGRVRGGGSRGAPGAAPHEASSAPARPRSSERGGSVSGRSSGACECASVYSAPSGAGEGEVARSQRTHPARAASSVASPRSSQHALQRGESGESSEVRSRSRSSRVSRSSDRGARKDHRARSRLDSSRDRSRRSRSRSAYRSRSTGRECRRRASSRSLSSRKWSQRDRSRSSDRSRSHRVCSRSRGDRSRSSDCYRSCRDRSRRDRSRSSGRYRSRQQCSRSPAHRGGPRDPPRRSRDHSRSRARSPPSSDRSRSKEGGRRARREKQEGVETAAVSQGLAAVSPAPSGKADDDRSSALDALDIDRDDSFQSVLALIQNFHNIEEPAGVPSARCKTSLASIYGLMSETSPAFHLTTSPLTWSLLDDTNLALSKFLEDQTEHGFLPVPGQRHRRYYRTSSSSFPGLYSVPPGVTSITLEQGSPTCGSGATCGSFKTLVWLQMLNKIPLYPFKTNKLYNTLKTMARFFTR